MNTLFSIANVAVLIEETCPPKFVAYSRLPSAFAASCTGKGPGETEPVTLALAILIRDTSAHPGWPIHPVPSVVTADPNGPSHKGMFATTCGGGRRTVTRAVPLVWEVVAVMIASPAAIAVTSPAL